MKLVISLFFARVFFTRLFFTRLFYISLTLTFTSPIAQASDPTKPQITRAQPQAVKQQQAKSTRQPLTAIFTKNKQSVALIEGRIYRRGDYYREQKIIQISLNKVTLQTSSGQTQLTLIPNIKK